MRQDMSKTVAVIGTFDTKGEEFLYLKECIENAGVATIMIDASGSDHVGARIADISNFRVADAAGVSLGEIIEKNDRGFAMDAMMKGCKTWLLRLYSEGKINGAISLGGSAGTTIGTYAMRALPVGVPKVQVSTVASGDTRPYVGTKDITMMYSVVDVAGLNSISKKIISNAANAVTGMVLSELPIADGKKLIAATMFGVTTPCVTRAKKYLEDEGYEVLVFHATGAGGMAMEALIEGGFITGVLDLTTTEMADELVGGVLTAGPDRMKAAVRKGLPNVVSTGALDMVNFGVFESVPQEFAERDLYRHNATITLMRTTVEENRALGGIIAQRINESRPGRTALLLPLKGVSLYDMPGMQFYGPDEDRALFGALREGTDTSRVEIIELDTDINDEQFAVRAARKLIELIEKYEGGEAE
jgi:uncharacterized protein (UPF0261 family)